MVLDIPYTRFRSISARLILVKSDDDGDDGVTLYIVMIISDIDNAIGESLLRAYYSSKKSS
jgi:hypothetical protein